MKINKSWFYLVLTILSWSLIPAVAKIGLGELNNFQLLCYSSIVGLFVLFLINLFQGKLKKAKEYNKKDYTKMFLLGILGIYLYHLFLYGSFSLAPAGQVNVANYLWPVFIVIFSIFILKEKFNYKTIIAILLSFLGVFIAFTQGDFYIFDNKYAFGYLLAAIGAVLYGLFSVLGKKIKYDETFSMLVFYISATVLIIPTAFILYGFVVPQKIGTIIAIFILGGLCNSTAFIFWFKALKSGNTHKIANVVYIIPFLAMIWTYFLNSEKISIFSLFGLILIIMGIFIQMKNKN